MLSYRRRSDVYLGCWQAEVHAQAEQAPTGPPLAQTHVWDLQPQSLRLLQGGALQTGCPPL